MGMSCGVACRAERTCLCRNDRAAGPERHGHGGGHRQRVGQRKPRAQRRLPDPVWAELQELGLRAMELSRSSIQSPEQQNHQ